MDKDSYISFSDYLDSCKNNQDSYSMASEEDVMREMEEVMKQFEGR